MIFIPHILIADDDKTVIDSIKVSLNSYANSKDSYGKSKFAKFFYSEVSAFDEMEKTISQDRVDVLVIDLSIPNDKGVIESDAGLYLVSFARKITNAGIIVYSGNDRDQYEFQCLEAGADYYLSKGGSGCVPGIRPHKYLRLYVDKLAQQSFMRRNIISRRSLEYGKAFEFSNYRFKVGDLFLTDRSKKTIPISVSEHDFFVLLFSSKDKIVKKEHYQRFVLPEQRWQTGKELSEVVRRLKKKLPKPIEILTIHEVGYRLNVGHEEISSP
ncbi:MAG: response regulator [Robiginitomaculum sp.]|nr:response regulator [Robiginitomaculum sp.]